MDLSLDERIRHRAYFLSMSGAGDDTTSWLIAEREVMAEVAAEEVTTAEVALAEVAAEEVTTAEVALAEVAAEEVTTAPASPKAAPPPVAKSMETACAEQEVVAEVATEEVATESASASPKVTPTPVAKSIETACTAAIVHVSRYRQLFAS
jgi:ribonuclease E